MLILNSAGFPDVNAHLWALDHFGALERADEKTGPCDDDREVTAPYIDGMPDEPDVFLSRPLKYPPNPYQSQIDEYAQRRADNALFDALLASDFDAMLKRQRAEFRKLPQPEPGKNFRRRNNHGYTDLSGR